MTTLQTKIISFYIESNLKINHIMGQRGTLYVTATISFEENDAFESLYFGYYDMSWSSVHLENKSYVIADVLRSKILAILSKSHYVESEAFNLCEKKTYDFSNIWTYTIKDIIK